MLTFHRVAILLIIVLCTGCASRLHIAAGDGDVDEVRRLVRNHPDSIESRYRGLTPLQTSVLCQQVAATSALIELGADVNATFDEGRYTALSAAKERLERCNVRYLAQQKQELYESRLQSDTKLGRLVYLERMYGPAAKPKWEQIIDMLEKAQPKTSAESLSG